MPEAEVQLARERIARFSRFGGIDLAGLAERGPLRSEVMAGVANYKRAVFGFECPFCGAKRTNDQEAELMCTGPSWTDDHPMELMTPLGIVNR